MRTYESLITIW